MREWHDCGFNPDPIHRMIVNLSAKAADMAIDIWRRTPDGRTEPTEYEIAAARTQVLIDEYTNRSDAMAALILELDNHIRMAIDKRLVQ